MLFRLVLIALGIYGIRRWLGGSTSQARSTQTATGQIDNPMFYRQDEDIAETTGGRSRMVGGTGE